LNALPYHGDAIPAFRARDVASDNDWTERMSESKMIDGFDYDAPAELFPTRSRKGNRPMGYRRFDKASEAIRFAMEELSPDLLVGAHLEVEEDRFDSEGIRRLYEHAEYPLARRGASSADEAPGPRAPRTGGRK